VKGSQLGAARMPQLGSLSASKSCATGVEATKDATPYGRRRSSKRNGLSLWSRCSVFSGDSQASLALW